MWLWIVFVPVIRSVCPTVCALNSWRIVELYRKCVQVIENYYCIFDIKYEMCSNHSFRIETFKRISFLLLRYDYCTKSFAVVFNAMFHYFQHLQIYIHISPLCTARYLQKSMTFNFHLRRQPEQFCYIKVFEEKIICSVFHTFPTILKIFKLIYILQARILHLSCKLFAIGDVVPSIHWPYRSE